MEPDDNRNNAKSIKFGYRLNAQGPLEAVAELAKELGALEPVSTNQNILGWNLSQGEHGINLVLSATVKIVAAMKQQAKWGTFSSASAGERFWTGFLKRVEWEAQHGSHSNT